ncbi:MULTISPECIES: alanine/ornithine racemase family PLP-dependent enzyme [Mesotoga]|uniref:alanine/ornithine racemase family PLP-dependent enzyme n=1 Tax=Mesotoga TaxID=1184396 RepID=UPI00217E7A30|nr:MULTISPECIES: alanine/ornithine racemase family PLP-dependent enzyme [Mesotoga]HNQ70224.1 alanine/ornithine racemase family PLP-dependent enzyme [Mesotoga prima]HNS74675.1 alanine/ornithine racemase family PLP-dependent enzyme [Mesotoga prima]HOP36722.1 alanine/ornithine racemase family PLP-dependent enzyme [Mesotoga prima]HOZ99854.1 alanine/ornithine racemase family PLP-dependent enzyme [Mesotoga prima]HPJ31195.1 alanine/ornithine racemase family PLP-dependent enzyme [Mesotoga prima]
MISLAKVVVNTVSIGANAKRVRELAEVNGVEIAAVTKVVCGDPTIASILLNSGVKEIGESRLENISRIMNAGIDSDFLLLRLPERSKFREVLDNVDTVLIGDLDSLSKLYELSSETGQEVNFIYMIDTGDLREGVMYYEAESVLEKAFEIAGENLEGIGTNLGCFGGVIATPKKFEILLSLGEFLRKKTGYSLRRYSAGNTASLPLLEKGIVPKGINHFRLGESILCGTDVTNNREVPGTLQDTFTLYGEVIEIAEKPSVPIGEIGRDAFGRIPHFEDKGKRIKAILDLGEQDVLPSGLTPLVGGCEVLHASSDHLIVDVTESEKSFSVGDSIGFRMSYGALLRVMTSPYIRKVYE